MGDIIEYNLQSFTLPSYKFISWTIAWLTLVWMTVIRHTRTTEADLQSDNNFIWTGVPLRFNRSRLNKKKGSCWGIGCFFKKIFEKFLLKKFKLKLFSGHQRNLVVICRNISLSVKTQICEKKADLKNYGWNFWNCFEILLSLST